jgi:hypothetical protein
VHKASHGGDWMQVGNYRANGVKQDGVWANATAEVKVDVGHFYASKDFWDPVGNGGAGRRINWGWATVPPASTQTLPREVTWNPELQQLVHSPLVEQDALRGVELADLAPVAPVAVPAGHTVVLYGGADGATRANQSEVEVTFALPTAPYPAVTRVGVVVMGGADPSVSGTSFWIDYQAPDSAAAVAADPWYTVRVGASAVTAPTPAPTPPAPTPPSPAPPSPWKRIMEDTDLPGGDFSVKKVAYTDPLLCQKACDDEEKCATWTLVPASKCCLKGSYPAIKTGVKGMTSGAKDPSKGPVPGAPTPAPAPHGLTDTLKLSPSDSTLTIRVYVDNTFSEAFWMGGRVAMTVDTPATANCSVALAAAGGAAVVKAATVHAVKPIWVSEAEVRAAPRTDGQPVRGW